MIFSQQTGSQENFAALEGGNGLYNDFDQLEKLFLFTTDSRHAKKNPLSLLHKSQLKKRIWDVTYNSEDSANEYSSRLQMMAVCIIEGLVDSTVVRLCTGIQIATISLRIHEPARPNSILCHYRDLECVNRIHYPAKPRAQTPTIAQAFMLSKDI